MSTYDSTAPKPDVYARVTSQIVNAIEQGTGNWRMPWHTSGRFAFSPINAVTHKPYRGVNVLALWAVARRRRPRSSAISRIRSAICSGDAPGPSSARTSFTRADRSESALQPRQTPARVRRAQGR
jgi:hypothetical protein